MFNESQIHLLGIEKKSFALASIRLKTIKNQSTVDQLL